MLSNKQEITAILTRKLASRQVSDADIEDMADRILGMKGVPRKIDVTEVGIVVDVEVMPLEVHDRLKDVLVTDKLDSLQVFPWGIVPADRYLLQVKLR